MFGRGYDRLGDPSAPPRYLRGRLRDKRVPPPPEPPEEPEPVLDAPLVCVRCCITPVQAQVAWNQAGGHLIHTSVIASTGPRGFPRICGAMVVPKGEEWRQAFVPGLVVPCLHTHSSVLAHLVRLGRPVNSGSHAWSGTALCGKVNAGRNRTWRPLYPAAAAQADVCAPCREAQAAEEGLAPWRTGRGEDAQPDERPARDPEDPSGKPGRPRH